MHRVYHVHVSPAEPGVVYTYSIDNGMGSTVTWTNDPPIFFADTLKLTITSVGTVYSTVVLDRQDLQFNGWTYFEGGWRVRVRAQRLTEARKTDVVKVGVLRLQALFRKRKLERTARLHTRLDDEVERQKVLRDRVDCLISELQRSRLPRSFYADDKSFT